MDKENAIERWATFIDGASSETLKAIRLVYLINN
jgi:hypothetical protein